MLAEIYVLRLETELRAVKATDRTESNKFIQGA